MVTDNKIPDLSYDQVIRGTHAPNASKWMQNLLPYIGDFPLTRICMPGAHDAGMSKIDTSVEMLGTPANTQTQSKSIFELLSLGARFFDLRPTLFDGKWYTAHGSTVNHLV